MRIDFSPRRYFNLTPEQIAKLTDDFQDLEKAVNEINKSLQDPKLEGALAKMSTSVEEMTDDLKKGVDITKELNTALKKAKLEDKKLSLEQNRIQAQLVDIEKQLSKAVTNKNDKLQKALKTQKETLENKSLDNLLQQELNEKIREHLETLGNINTKEKEVTEEKKKQNTLSGFATSKYKEISDQLKKFFSFATAFKAILDSAFRFSRISTEIGKNLGYGADNANRVASNMVSIAQSSLNANITLQNLGDAANELNTATGLVAEYSDEALETQIMLTKQFGLTGEEAAGIYKFSALTGQSSKTVNDNMVKAFVATRNQLKVGVPFKATIAEAAKVSGRLAANLQNNPEQIVKAVVATKALGASLEQTSKQGEALLNFESSIESELKAELITGKQLNLERARAAALVGDQVTLAQELSSQIGSLEEFQKMNVVQQKSIAEAVGLTADELADQLRKQELAIKNGESLAELTEREALEAQQRQDIQDKFNNAVLKLQDALGNILAGPLSKLIEGFENLLGSSTGIVAAITALTAISFGKTLASLATMAASLGLSAAGALTTASAISFGIGIVAVIAGLAAAMGAFNSSKEEAVQPVKDGVAMPGRGPFTITDNFGATAITAAGDGLAVSPNINRGGGGIDLSPLIAAVNEVKNAINTLAAKPQPAMAIQVGAEKLGEVVGNQSSTGTSQAKNTSYSLA